MNILNSIFWFRKGNESVSVVIPQRTITEIKVENAEVSNIYKSADGSIEITFYGDRKRYYKLLGGENLPKVVRAYRNKVPKDKILFSAILEVEDYNPNPPSGKIVKVSKLK